MEKDKIKKLQLDREFEVFKVNFRQMVLDGGYSTDLYHVDDEDWRGMVCATYDFMEYSKGVDAHVDVYFAYDEGQGLMPETIHVWPRLGDGDPLANGEGYEYDITDDPDVMAAVKGRCEDDVYCWFEDQR